MRPFPPAYRPCQMSFQRDPWERRHGWVLVSCFSAFKSVVYSTQYSLPGTIAIVRLGQCPRFFPRRQACEQLPRANVSW